MIVDIDQIVQSLIGDVRAFIDRTDRQVEDLSSRVEELEKRIQAIEEMEQ